MLCVCTSTGQYTESSYYYQQGASTSSEVHYLYSLSSQIHLSTDPQKYQPIDQKDIKQETQLRTTNNLLSKTKMSPKMFKETQALFSMGIDVLN